MKLTIISSAILAITSVGLAQASPVYKLLKPVTTLAVEGQSSNNTAPIPTIPTKLAFNESISNHEVLLNSIVQKSLTLTNEGPDSVSALKLTTNKGSITNTTCSTSLAKNDSCVTTVQYPVNDMSATTVELTAAGTAANKSVSAVSSMTIQPLATMQDVQLQNASALALKAAAGVKTTTSFNVVNPNPYEINLSNPTFLAGTVEPSTTCGTTLAAGASCTITVSATPLSTTAVNGSVQFVASKQGVEFPHSTNVSIQAVDPYAGFIRINTNFEGLTNLNAIPAVNPNVKLEKQGAATLATEPNGNKYLKLDGYSSLRTTTAFKTLNGDFTISFDVKFNDLGYQGGTMTPSLQNLLNTLGSSSVKWAIYWQNLAPPASGWTLKLGSNTIQPTLPAKPVVGQWYHVSLVRKNNVVTFKIDNQIVHTSTFAGVLGDASYTYYPYLEIGNYASGETYGLNGGMDNIFIADAAP